MKYIKVKSGEVRRKKVLAGSWYYKKVHALFDGPFIVHQMRISSLATCPSGTVIRINTEGPSVLIWSWRWTDKWSVGWSSFQGSLPYQWKWWSCHRSSNDQEMIIILMFIEWSTKMVSILMVIGWSPKWWAFYRPFEMVSILLRSKMVTILSSIKMVSI